MRAFSGAWHGMDNVRRRASAARHAGAALPPQPSDEAADVGGPGGRPRAHRNPWCHSESGGGPSSSCTPTATPDGSSPSTGHMRATCRTCRPTRTWGPGSGAGGGPPRSRAPRRRRGPTRQLRRAPPRSRHPQVRHVRHDDALVDVTKRLGHGDLAVDALIVSTGSMDTPVWRRTPMPVAPGPPSGPHRLLAAVPRHGCVLVTPPLWLVLPASQPRRSQHAPPFPSGARAAARGASQAAECAAWCWRGRSAGCHRRPGQ
jgi:hypothetical protein